MLSVISLSVVMLIVILPSVVMLDVVLLSDIMASVINLSFTAPISVAGEVDKCQSRPWSKRTLVEADLG